MFCVRLNDPVWIRKTNMRFHETFSQFVNPRLTEFCPFGPLRNLSCEDRVLSGNGRIYQGSNKCEKS